MERKTRQRQAILDVIVDAQRPLLAQEVLLMASVTVPRLSLATVYRNIKGLYEEGLLKVVHLPGQNPRYEPANSTHHHHFQCRQCERVFDLESCLGNMEQLAPSGFLVEDHEVILYGRCGACAG
ncbi:Fur family transcriptional regulator [Parvibium lacunae]|uniref:Ferric uptake regulation protein n=1 Tax=Parvibium lacunae TaxID=1888893 RepID=A0A368L4N8_9BURK|nr:transcriptional repressor [Parvibium lacunae]RCS58120.1 transcriptional repressor [Parvibium lacunae]